jgi:DNA polymerase-3 subunit chi
MTRVDFYLLENDSAGGKERTTCMLANKAFLLGHRIYILTPTHEDSQNLDRLLWTFSPGSFVPHGLHSQDMEVNLPVLIGHEEPPPDQEDVLITLAPRVPDFFSRFQRVAEIVGPAEADKQLARERFRYYRDRGCAPASHNL